MARRAEDADIAELILLLREAEEALQQDLLNCDAFHRQVRDRLLSCPHDD